MTKKTWLVAGLTGIVLAALASGCTVTLPEHGRRLSIGPAANPGAREMPPFPSGPGLAHDDRISSR